MNKDLDELFANKVAERYRYNVMLTTSTAAKSPSCENYADVHRFAETRSRSRSVHSQHARRQRKTRE